jgi:hypothetical protein
MEEKSEPTSKAEFWKGHVLAAEKFIGSDVGYCREHELNPGTFYAYKRKFRKTVVRKRAQAFVEVQRVSRAEPLPSAAWLAEFLVSYQQKR